MVGRINTSRSHASYQAHMKNLHNSSTAISSGIKNRSSIRDQVLIDRSQYTEFKTKARQAILPGINIAKQAIEMQQQFCDEISKRLANIYEIGAHLISPGVADPNQCNLDMATLNLQLDSVRQYIQELVSTPKLNGVSLFDANTAINLHRDLNGNQLDATKDIGSIDFQPLLNILNTHSGTSLVAAETMIADFHSTDMTKAIWLNFNSINIDVTEQLRDLYSVIEKHSDYDVLEANQLSSIRETDHAEEVTNYTTQNLRLQSAAYIIERSHTLQKELSSSLIRMLS